MEHWTKKNAHQYHQPLEFIKLEPLLTYVLYNLLTDKFNKKNKLLFKFNNYQLLLQFHLRSVLSIDSVV